MPITDKVKKIETSRLHYLNNKEYYKHYYMLNKEKIKKMDKIRHSNNRHKGINFNNEFKEYINNEIYKFNFNSVMFELMECYIIYYTEFLNF